jgi:electron transfer flavoprotein alpha subunit
MSLANGRTRLLRGEDLSANAIVESHTPVAETVPLRIIDNPAYLIFVVPDAVEGRLSVQDRDLIGLGRSLADQAGGAVCVVLFAEHHDDLGVAGADRVLRLQTGTAAGAHAPDAQAKALCKAMNHLHPRHVLLPESDWAGSDLGRRVAALSSASIATGVWRADLESASCYTNGGTQELMQKTPVIAIVRADVGEPVENARHEARQLAIESGTNATAFGDRGMRPYDPQAVSLEEAEFILAAGNGVSDWPTFHALAAALGASEGGSRVVVDAGAIPRDRQVGATGSITSARCYIALGISGAPQHLQGISACEHVIAVNRDSACDMVKRANLAIIADVQQVMKALLAMMSVTNKS